MSLYFSKPNSSYKDIKNESDLFNYATKSDAEKARGTSSLAKNVDISSLKSDVHKFHNDKLKNFPTNLNILKSDVDKLDADKLKTVPIDRKNLVKL